MLSDELDKGPNQDEILEYNMKHPQRGKLLIFNNRNFREMSKRLGSDKDASKIFQIFKQLGFKVKIHLDKTSMEMKHIISEESFSDHANEDCIAICILSHGDETGIYGSDDNHVVLEDLIGRLKTCKTLAGKPKLLFIETSLGNKEDTGIIIESDGGFKKPDRIPIEADFLYCYSTVPGFKSLRTSDHDSWFVNTLCEMLRIFGKSMEITEILTRVNYVVARKFQSENHSKQIPSFVSMLTKQLSF